MTPQDKREVIENAGRPKDDIQQEQVNRESEKEDRVIINRNGENTWPE